MRHGSLFSGIGGFDLAAQWMGWENIFHCEWNPFGQRVLKYYWPKAKSYEDITKTDFTIWRGKIDILTGGFPCQPYSAAGKRLGKEDDRHLWPEMLRAIREIQPTWVVGENVLGLVNWNGGLVFDEVQADLEAQGYEVQPYVLPAISVDAPHRRDRVWFVAYSKRIRLEHPSKARNFQESPGKARSERGESSKSIKTNGSRRTSANPYGFRLRGQGDGIGKPGQPNQESQKCYWQDFPTESPVRTGNDGFPSQLDGITFSKWRNESIKAGGNAIVPQVAHQIFKAINQYNQL